MDFVADILDQIETRGVGFHDDIEQHRRDVGMRAHQAAAFGGRVGRQDFQRLAAETVVAQGKSRTLVHGRVVVDDGDLPFACARCFRNGSGIVDQVEDIVLFGHWELPWLACSPITEPRLAALGMIMRNVVPCPSLDSSIIRPPSCWVTRL